MLTDAIFRALVAVPSLQRQFRKMVFRLPHRQRLVQHFGQELWVDPSELSGFYVYYERNYDDYIFQFLSARIAGFDRALDIGANIGIYTVFLAARIARIDAFEPEPLVLQRLTANLEQNGLASFCRETHDFFGSSSPRSKKALTFQGRAS